MLADTLYTKAKVPPTKNVCLWLGVSKVFRHVHDLTYDFIAVHVLSDCCHLTASGASECFVFSNSFHVLYFPTKQKQSRLESELKF